MGEAERRLDHPEAARNDDRKRGQEHQRGHEHRLAVREPVIRCMALAEEAHEAPRRTRRAEREQRHVRDEHDREKYQRHPGVDPPEDERARDESGCESDNALDRKRLTADPDRAAEQRAEADHRREVEDVRAEDHTDADAVLSLGERRDRRGGLGRVGCERGQQAEQRLRQAEPQADAVEPAREERGRGQRDR